MTRLQRTVWAGAAGLGASLLLVLAGCGGSGSKGDNFPNDFPTATPAPVQTASPFPLPDSVPSPAPAPSVSPAPTVLTGQAALGDWTTDAPGVRRHLTVADLPAPFASDSANNGSRIVPRPADAWPQAPPGFVVEKYAGDLNNPPRYRNRPRTAMFLWPNLGRTAFGFCAAWAATENFSKPAFLPPASISRSALRFIRWGRPRSGFTLRTQTAWCASPTKTAIWWREAGRKP